MFRLFPRSWFNGSSAASRRRANVVEVLDKNWRRWLVDGLTRVDPELVIDSDKAIVALAGLESRKLLLLDEVLRYGFWASGADHPSVLIALTPVGNARPETDAFLFVTSSNPDGFVREQALLAFHHYPGRLALAAALIRCDDWVTEVRQTAAELLVDIAAQPSVCEIYPFLDLLLSLRRRTRFESLWADRIEPQLLAPRRREERWAATTNGTADARLFAFEAVLSVDEDRVDQALAGAITDLHPGIARWALARRPRASNAAVQDALLDHARRHPRAAVRADAVRCDVQRGFVGALEKIEEALFDPARAPRNAAAHALRTIFQLSPLDVWRAVLDSACESVKRRHTAVAALSEHAQSEDYPRLLPWLPHGQSRMRALALRGVARTRPDNLSAHLANALSDPAPKVVKQALQLIRQEGQSMDRAWLEEAYARAGSSRLRAILARSARLLGKWEIPDLLLTWIEGSEGEDFDVLAAELSQWLVMQNRRFTPLTVTCRAQLLARLAKVEYRRPDALWQQVGFVLRVT